jgi:hypothetical protein
MNKVGRNLMHLEMFAQAEANLRDDQAESTIRAMEHLDRVIYNLTSRVGA